MTQLAIYKHNLVKTKRRFDKARIKYAIVSWTDKTAILEIQPKGKDGIKKAIQIAHEVGADSSPSKGLWSINIFLFFVGVFMVAYTVMPAVHTASIAGIFLFSGIGKFIIFFIGSGVFYAFVSKQDADAMKRTALRQLPKAPWESEASFQSRKKLGKQMAWMPGYAWWVIVIFIVVTVTGCGYIYYTLGVLTW